MQKLSCSKGISHMNRGIFIVLEGIDGAGTTTHVQLLADWLEKQGKAVLVTQEPTKRQIGTLLRTFLTTNETSAEVDALLFAADRLDHLESTVRPALEEKKIVICDRYRESSITYQTAAGLPMDWLLNVNKFAEEPDITIILDISPKIGLSRKEKVGDKFENEEFLKKVRSLYLERAKERKYPIIRTDGAIEMVHLHLRKLVQPILVSNKL
ncbi:MAG: dTMP kinase [Promethearchaeota archaeon]|nr:MAG: dTMP kinase [Candidatus Lokiarchaeota archaeon]